MNRAAGRSRWWQAGFGLACALHLYGLYWPRQAGPDAAIPYADKVAHLLLFGAVAYLGLRIGLPARWVIGALVVDALASELVQHHFLPARSGDPFDSLADLAGTALGVWLALRPGRHPSGARGPSTRPADTP